MVEIEIGNARSRIRGLDNAQAHALQKYVAYRATDLPPVAVIRKIKEFSADLWRFRQTPRERLRDFLTQEQEMLTAIGWTQRLTPTLFEKSRNVTLSGWDGWTSLVTRNGVFGTGLIAHVKRALTLRMGVPESQIKIIDTREDPSIHSVPRLVAQSPSLYPFQEEAVTSFFEHGGRGVIHLPPRSGKTRIIIAIIDHLHLPSLIVVPGRGLVEQTRQRFLELGWPEDQVIGITGGKSAMSQKKKRAMSRALVWICTPPTAAGSKDQKGNRSGIWNIQSRKVLIMDETHHSAADTWRAISDSARNAYYRLGTTGTFFRADGKDMLMHSVLSQVVYERTILDMVRLGRLVPARVAMVRSRTSLETAYGDRLYTEGVTDHEARNTLLVQGAHELIRQRRRVLVLTKEVDHARSLAYQIGCGAVQVDGTMPTSSVKLALDQLGAGQIPCVVGTSVIGEGVIGEGRDVPNADALVYAAAGKSKVKQVQDFFRCLTSAEGKKNGIIIDAADDHHPRLTEAAAQRLSTYRQCFEADVIDQRDIPGWVASVSGS